MRTIMFRGKRIDNGQWSTGDLIQLLGKQGRGRKFIVDNRFGACIDSNGDFVNTEAPFVNEVDPQTVGQYTGLQDKHGKEIYEGDLIVTELGKLYKVVFHNAWGSFCASSVHHFQSVPFWNDSKKYEIIGNVHENAELLDRREAQSPFSAARM